MKEYMIEDGPVYLSQLEAPMMSTEDYMKTHQGIVIPCHDIFVQYEGGLLLVKRLNYPAKDILWPLGGRIQRGKTTEDSLRERIFNESNLELSDLIELGYARTFFKTAPFSLSRGTDSINFVFYGKGKGSLNLDNAHEQPTIISPQQYVEYRTSLHPYVRDFMDKAIPLVK